MKNKKYILILLLSVFAFTSFISRTNAEPLNFLSTEISDSEINLNDQIIIKFYINQKDGRATTALSGEINFESSFLELDKIITGNSIFPLWIDQPKEVSSGLISFSGIATGGFKEKKGEIFSLVLKTKKEGVSAITIDIDNFLKDNGEDTQIENAVRELLIQKPDQSTPYREIIINDDNPPLEFSPVIMRNLGNKGSVSLVFATIDRETGLSHFEILFSPIRYEAEEISTNKEIIWRKIESPFFLTKQQQQLNIYLRAIDSAGNKRTVIIPPINSYDQGEKNYYWLTIPTLISLVLFLIFLFKNKWGLRNKQKDKML